MVGQQIWKKFGDYMSAAAFAEAGEAETARSMIRRPRTVLLVLTPKGADVRSAGYARSVCSRIGADMEILALPGNGKQLGFVRELEKQLVPEGIGVRVVTTSGCIKQGILKHTSRRSDIQFVVIESPEELDIQCGEETKGRTGSFFSRLSCPLVVVSEAGSGA